MNWILNITSSTPVDRDPFKYSKRGIKIVVTILIPLTLGCLTETHLIFKTRILDGLAYILGSNR